MASINTNLSALAAQNNMREQTRQLDDAMSRLSSGLRINSAADDAAGSAIASKMEAQVRSLDVAIRNSYDAISMTQTAEGALGEMENILQRTRELAVQAGNSTLSSSDRTMIQKELDALVTEIDSIATKTNFNGVKLLDGSNSSLNFQIGINKGDGLNVELQASGTKALGLEANRTVNEYTSGRVSRFNYSANLAASDVQINKNNALSANFTTDLSTANTATNGAKLFKNAINLNSSVHGATASAFNSLTSAFKTEFTMSDTFSINGAAITVATSSSNLVDNINSEATGVTATLNANNTITLENNTGDDIIIHDATGTGATDVGFNVAGGDGVITAGTVYSGFIKLENNDGSAVQIEANNNANGFTTNLGTITDVTRLGFNQVKNDKSIVSGSVSSAAITTDDDVKINDVAIGTSVGSSAASKAIAINAVTDQTLVSASASNEIIVSVDLDAEPVSGASATKSFDYGTPSNTMVFSDGTNTVTATSLANLKTAVDGITSKGYVASVDGTKLVITAGTSGAVSQAFGSESFTAKNGAVKEVKAITIGSAETSTAYSKMTLSNGTDSHTVQIFATDATPDNTDALAKLIAIDAFNDDVVLTTTGATNLTLTAKNAGTAISGSYTVTTTSSTATALGSAETQLATGDADDVADQLKITLTTNSDGSNGALSMTEGYIDIVATGSAVKNGGADVTIFAAWDTDLDTTTAALAAAINARTDITFSADIMTNKDLLLIADSTDVGALVGADVIVSKHVLVDNTADAAAASNPANAAGTSITATTTAAVTGSIFTINGTSLDLTAADELSDVVSSINTASIGDLEASATTDGKLKITSVGGDNISMRDTTAGFVTAVTDATSSAIDITTNRGTSIQAATGITAYGVLNLKSSGDGIIKVSGENESVLGLAAQAETQTLVSGGIKVNTLTDAQQAIVDIDKAIEQISSYRSSFGAVENRIDASINNLTTLKVNTEAAKSRIQDADFAAETSKMTKSQILSQAATSMLAQANASKQNLLALLQG